MALTLADVVEGRIATILLILFLSFVLFAHLFVKPPASVLPMMIAVGAIFAILLQNLILYINDIRVPETSD